MMSKVYEVQLRQSQASLKQCKSENQELRNQVDVPRELQYITAGVIESRGIDCDARQTGRQEY